eukprot:602623-Rhodomonas_salina.1
MWLYGGRLTQGARDQSQSLASKKGAKKEAGPKHGESTAAADAELDAYFRQQQELAGLRLGP